jgi:hypothetical protein
VPVCSTYRHHRIRRVHFRLKALSQNGRLGIEKMGAKIGKFPSADTGQLTASGKQTRFSAILADDAVTDLPLRRQVSHAIWESRRFPIDSADAS